MAFKGDNKYYTATWYSTILPANYLITDFKIISANRELQIRRIYLGININSSTGNIVPWRNNGPDPMFLSINYGAGPFSEGLVFVSGTAWEYTGAGIRLYEPGVYEFNGFKVKNQIEFILHIENRDANNRLYDVSIAVKTRENIIY